MAAIDQALLLELDRHPRSTAEELSGYLRGVPPRAAPTPGTHGSLPVRPSETNGRQEKVTTAAVRRWLRSHEGWLVRRDARRWRLSPEGEGFLAALD